MSADSNHYRNRAGFLPAGKSPWLGSPYWWVASLFLLIAIWLSLTTPVLADESQDNECIILLHGLGRSAMSMKGVQWRLEDEGYTVVNNSYSWMDSRIEDIAPLAIDESRAECQALGKTTVGFVTHSLGGILLRQYLEDHTIQGLGRVVMLAPPNQGSTLADHLVANEYLEPLLPEPAHQLGTGEKSIPKQLGPVQFELGVIAGSNTRTLMSQGLENVANDGTVAVEETRVDGMQDFLVMPVDHSFLMWRDAVLDQVVLFLRQGRFDHTK